MSDKTLYLVQSNYASTAPILDQLAQIYAPEDQVVLMGESVLFSSHDFIKHLNQVYILEQDTELLNQSPNNSQIIDYAAFATLCLQFNRCVSMK